MDKSLLRAEAVNIFLPLIHSNFLTMLLNRAEKQENRRNLSFISAIFGYFKKQVFRWILFY